jgi:hypothetical protein
LAVRFSGCTTLIRTTASIAALYAGVATPAIKHVGGETALPLPTLPVKFLHPLPMALHRVIMHLHYLHFHYSQQTVAKSFSERAVMLTHCH